MVILIILIISAVALPTIIPAISHRQVSEAGRILQGALVGARDAAIRNNGPSGIRLLPDAVFNGINANLQLDPTLPLAYSRVVPIEPAPEYSEGMVNVVTSHPYLLIIQRLIHPRFTSTGGLLLPRTCHQYDADLPLRQAGTPWPSRTGTCSWLRRAVDTTTTSGFPNSPTSWFWNIRVGDKIQINSSGVWYTVVGPMAQTPVNGNTEMFVNVGVPGTTSPLVNGNFNPEFLFLVNGQDDNGNGWVDEGWDGVDNNGNGVVDELGEWETETWGGAITKHGVVNSPYVIQRRPAPTTNAREVSLPTNVVIDATTWGYPTLAGPSLERSRLPINLFTGYVDILVYPNGTIVPTTVYSSASSFPMAASFLHFWVAERSDVAAPTPNTVNATHPPFLPLPKGLFPTLFSSGAELKGEYRLVTLNSRTGQVSTDEEMAFDANLSTDISTGKYNPSVPFREAQQGVRGGP